MTWLNDSVISDKKALQSLSIGGIAWGDTAHKLCLSLQDVDDNSESISIKFI